MRPNCPADSRYHSVPSQAEENKAQHNLKGYNQPPQSSVCRVVTQSIRDPYCEKHDDRRACDKCNDEPNVLPKNCLWVARCRSRKPTNYKNSKADDAGDAPNHIYNFKYFPPPPHPSSPSLKYP